MDLRELRFGVEIETVRRTRKRVAEAVQSVVGGNVTHPGRPGVFDPWEVVDGQGRTWKVVSDASLSHVPSHLRAEVVTPVLAYADIPTLQEVIRSVRKCGAKVDGHCGIHVHVEASRFDGRTLGNLAKIVYKQEPLILAALGVTENRQRTYTRPVRDDLIRDIECRRPRTTDELNRIWYGYHNRHPQHFDGARYDFRVFLFHLELIGDEFKTARKHLLAALPGDSAFRRGRPAPEPSPATEADITTEAGPQTRPPAFEEEITTQTEGENTP